jgi:hypothetical protein
MAGRGLGSFDWILRGAETYCDDSISQLEKWILVRFTKRLHMSYMRAEYPYIVIIVCAGLW